MRLRLRAGAPRSLAAMPLLAAVALAGVSVPATATDSAPELRVVLRDLMAWLPGEYDNAAQVFFEREQKTPGIEVHSRIYRAYHRLDAPEVGEHVLLFEVRNGGKTAPLDLAELQVWTLTVDEPRRAVRMSPRRLTKKGTDLFFPDRNGPVVDPGKINLSPSELEPATGIAGCDIFWRLDGRQLVGRTAPGECKGTSRRTGAPMDFTWEFTQNEGQQWINFAGRDASGRIVFGREDQTAWRLDKARDFECFVTWRPPGEAASVLNGVRLHDRGDRHAWRPQPGAARTFTLELLRGMWPSSSGRNFEDLLRLYLYDGDPGDPADASELLAMSWASAASDRTGFTSGAFSARCKLADRGTPPAR
ncbi:MAG: hypothetical protein MUF07_09845 [Steroidobacteraceae bacterium]|nr:hypothetical protein [Steroidobacteraceae bacterium]